MNIIPKLNLNKHPKDSDNLSLVNANHVKLSDDGSCITSEESIRENTFIHSYLISYYGTSIAYKVVGVIACNNELVIVVKPANTIDDADIFRYQEPLNNNIEKMYCAYGGIGNLNRFKYYGGLIKGTFTYNVENSLIIAITEYNAIDKRIPLRTINLGNTDDPTVYNDKDLSNAKLSISPEVRIPSVRGLEYVAGGAYKGWYYLFIRYKINTVDYTQWHSIGMPIYVDSLEQYQIVRYCYNRDTKFANSQLNNIVSPANSIYGFGAGYSDYFSNTSDIAKETFKVDLHFDQAIDYTKYQIGVICTSKSYTKAFRTSDIYIDKDYEDFNITRMQQYMLDNKSLIEYNVADLITDNFNYYNSKNIISYNNRLYISNYLEDNANDDNISQTLIDNINVDLTTNYVADYGLVYDTGLIVGDSGAANQYDTYSMTIIPLHVYLNVSEDTIIHVRADGQGNSTDKAGRFYIVSNNNQTPAYAYIEYRSAGPLGSVIKTNYGKPPAQTTVYITLPSKEGTTEPNVNIFTGNLAMNGGMRYTNTNISFNSRKKESCLIPGEVYNFFIHFTNKYNASTNGYKLQNKVVWDTEDNVGVEILVVPFNIKVGGSASSILTYYAAVPLTNNVTIQDFSTDNGYTIDITNVKFYTSMNEFNTRLTSKVIVGNEASVITAFKEHFSSYADVKFLKTKWYQVSYNTSTTKFDLFINNNGDRLFKIPISESFTLRFDGFPDEVEDFKTYNLHVLMRASFSNIEIPEGYDGYYISYELFESQRRATGMLTRNDFRSEDYISVGGVTALQPTLNAKKSDRMFFYSSIYDISDTIKLDYNIMRVEAVNPFKKNDIPHWDYFQINFAFNFVHDQNKPQIESYGGDLQKTYAMPDYKIAVADSAIDNRMGLGTALQIKDAYNLFPNYEVSGSLNNLIKLYRVTLLNTTRDIYMSNNKKLIRLTDVYYRNADSPINQKYSTGTIATGYNGHYTYDGIIVFENAGVTFNTTTNKVTAFNYGNEFYQSEVNAISPHVYQNDIAFNAYIQMPICMDTFLESKSFKNEPKGVIYLVKSGEGITNKFAKGSMVIPANTIDLFENKQGTANQFNPKTYTNFRNDLVSIEQYDKTVRRSNIIQDESRINGWRTFPIEAYKNITENKGKITNLIGIGYILLVHTEHSLFQFNTDATLKTKDQDIQLLQPDAFDVDYKEVFTSDKGYGGLQDDKSFLIDTFGYIFYSEDTHRIYGFDDNALDNIDADIIQWLSKYKPFKVRMANDKDNSRILMKFDYIINNQLKHTVLSYNYKSKSFISQHLYYFDDAYSTKTKLYMKCDNDHNGCSLHNFDFTTGQYGRYDNIKGSEGIVLIRPAKLSIIINNAIDNAKFLEFITYKLVKYIDDINIDYTHLPVEEYKTPYAGTTLAVYNNLTNTGVQNISVDIEANKNQFAHYDKPYWDLGFWNFSYLFNNIAGSGASLPADETSRIYGNYFIAEFLFDNIDSRRIDFEDLNYNVSEL